MKDNSAAEVLDMLTELLLFYADELSDPEYTFPNKEFVHGELSIIVEILEIIKYRGKSDRLNFDIEEVYPV